MKIVESRSREHIFHFWMLIFFFFLLLYGLTAQKGVSWQDSGMYQWRVLKGDFVGKDGLALAHPLYVWAGRMFVSIFPFGALPWKLNFFSGVGAAIALSNLAILGYRITSDYWAATIGVLTLGFSHTFWWLSTVTEVYTWSSALLVLEFLVLFSICKKPNRLNFILLAFLNGVGFSIHNFALLPFPIYLSVLLYFLMKHSIPRDTVFWGGVAYLIGASPMIIFALKIFFESADTFLVIKSLFFGNKFMHEVLSTGNKVDLNLLKANAALFILNLVNPVWLCAILGVAKMRIYGSQFFRSGFFLIFFIEVFFFARYFVPDQVTFSLPTLCMLEVFCTIGLHELFKYKDGALKRKFFFASIVLICLTPFSYFAMDSFLHARGITISRTRNLPFRDEISYWLIPWKQEEKSAARFAREALKAVSPIGGIIMADHTAYYPLVLEQELGAEANNVLIKHAGSVDRAWLKTVGKRNLFVVSPVEPYAPYELLKMAPKFKKQGVLYLVTGKY